jgi:hypothetical protein
MLLPIFAVLIIVSIVGLITGLYYRNVVVLFVLNLVWWIGSFISAYFVWLAWLDRGYSENWAMIGFMSFSLPISIPTIIMLSIELFFIRKRHDNQYNILRLVSILLLSFLVLQMIMGVFSS